MVICTSSTTRFFLIFFTVVIHFIPGTFHFLTEPEIFCCDSLFPYLHTVVTISFYYTSNQSILFSQSSSLSLQIAVSSLLIVLLFTNNRSSFIFPLSLFLPLHFFYYYQLFPLFLPSFIITYHTFYHNLILN